MHVHGADGCDAMDATPEALQRIAAYKARHGVTAFLPTTMTDTPEAICAALANIGAHQGATGNGAEILGAHVEGPYFDMAKKGAQPAAYIRRADAAEYAQWFDLCTVGIISLAPEFPENHALIEYARAKGAAVSVGHSSATYEQVLEAVRLGVNHVTHTYNGMMGLDHRTPGVAPGRADRARTLRRGHRRPAPRPPGDDRPARARQGRDARPAHHGRDPRDGPSRRRVHAGQADRHRRGWPAAHARGQPCREQPDDGRRAAERQGRHRAAAR
ncbi:MAG: hypothetical protein M5R40_25440 [Anaerolineae bacterium]|nr:hypothetical protein [Anaerolineae bacterium]